MENNRRSFFKGLAAFASGVVAAKVASYTPKKEEPKEEVLVTNTITLIGPGGEPYHPLVVAAKQEDKAEKLVTPPINGNTVMHVNFPKPKVRKADI
jgi:hypothetical protein